MASEKTSAHINITGSSVNECSTVVYRAVVRWEAFTAIGHGQNPERAVAEAFRGIAKKIVRRAKKAQDIETTRAKKAQAIETTKAGVNLIGQRLKLGIDDLGSVLRVSRVTVWGWKKGYSSPKDGTARIEQISALLNEAGITKPLQLSPDDRRFLLYVLSAEQLDRSEVLAALAQVTSGAPKAPPVDYQSHFCASFGIPDPRFSDESGGLNE